MLLRSSVSDYKGQKSLRKLFCIPFFFLFLRGDNICILIICAAMKRVIQNRNTQFLREKKKCVLKPGELQLGLLSLNILHLLPTENLSWASYYFVNPHFPNFEPKIVISISVSNHQIQNPLNILKF